MDSKSPAYFEMCLYKKLNQLLQEKSFSKVYILCDSVTREKCLPDFLDKSGLQSHSRLISIPAGELHKNITQSQAIWTKLSELGADRHSLLINLGGGVITDIGGFTASTYLRGIKFLNIPTSLLGMVDAAIGSKNGINFNGIKNSIGAFNTPEFVGVDTQFLRTLSTRQIKNGKVEMLKHGLIRSIDHWRDLISRRVESVPDREVIERSIGLKESVVSRDKVETGLRKILNFGHTLGHAIESLSLKKHPTPLLHGEAIAIGIVLESYISTKLSGLRSAEFNSILDYFSKNYPSCSFSRDDIAAIKTNMAKDKKSKNGSVNFVLLKAIGTPQIDCEVPDSLIDEAFEFLKNHKI